MSRPRRVLLVVLVLLAVLAAAGIALWLQGAEWLRRSLEAELQKRLVPAVSVAGPVGLSLQPRPALTVGGVVLRDGEGRTLLAVREIAVAFDRERLFGETPTVDELRVSGLALVLGRAADGAWNVAGWLRETPAGEGGGALAIGRILVEDAEIRLEGEETLAVEGLRLEAGPFAPGAAGAAALGARLRMGGPLPADLRLDGNLAYRLEAAVPALEALRLAATGSVGEWRIERGETRAASLRRSEDGSLRLEGITLALQVAGAPGTLAADGRLTRLDGRDGAWQGEALAVDLRAEREGQTIEGTFASPAPTLGPEGWRVPALTLTLAGGGTAPPLRLTLEGAAHGGPSASVDLAIARAALALPHPAQRPEPLALSFTGTARLDPATGAADGTLAGGFDDTRFDGRFRYAPDAPRPLAFELGLDRLNLDAYLPPPSEGGGPPDLTAWRRWPVEADLRIGELRFRDMVGEDARLRLSGGED